MLLRNLFAIICLIVISTSLYSQENFWTKTDENQLSQAAFTRNQPPAHFKSFSLNETALRQFLLATPSNRNIRAENSSSILLMPNERGGLSQFRIVESNVLGEYLARQNPTIKTYSGIGIDNPSATIGFSMTSSGIEAIVLSNEQTILIEKPGMNTSVYVVYSKNEVAGGPFDCTTTGFAQQMRTTLAGVNDGKLRKFDLVLACTGEFSESVLAGGSYPDDQAKRTKVRERFASMLVKINEIYKREVSAEMILVKDTVFLDPATDPWSAVNYSTSSITQNLFDNDFGGTSYNLGHLLHKVASNGDGNAGGIGVICVSGQNGRAYSAYENPLSSLYELDFFAHELGHQFGAYHTFSYRIDGTNPTPDQCEPGKGTTIMGYAGLSGSPNADVQAHTDDYFHTMSIDRISVFLTSLNNVANCGTITNSGNQAPAANAGADYIIPPYTPFILKGDGSDQDNDPINYCWEQVDAIQTQRDYPLETDLDGSTFRSQRPSSSKERVMPVMDSILYNKNKNRWEVLSAVARDLHFRLTVRDINSNGSNNNFDDMKVTVGSGYDTFKVTYPNTPVVWKSGETRTVTWKTGSTPNPPISCSQVAIDYSADGGYTFSTLLASTANDGSADITVPDTSTHFGRIRIRALGNIFFDISDSNFMIKDSLCLKIYKMDSVPIFATNLFTTIGVGKQGMIWAGTSRLGLYKFNGTGWQKFSLLTNNLFNDIKTDRDGGIWIAQSGFNGAQATTGAIHNFQDTSWTQTTYNVSTGNIPSRNVRSLFIDSSRYNGPTFLPVVWSAHSAHITGGVSSSGGVGRGLNPVTPYFNVYRTGLETTNGLGSCDAMGGDSSEVWTFAANNFGKSQILRYSGTTTQFIGAYDSTNVSNTVLNSNFQVKAIYFDGKKRKWAGLQSGGIAIMDTLKWKRINFPPLFSGSTSVNTNAITGDLSGKVYIGTTNGLIVFEGGPVDSLKSYRLYDTLDGLPSNNIRGIAIDTFTKTIAIATGNGIAIWDPACRGADTSSIVVTSIAHGNWSNPATWSNNKVPDGNTRVIIIHNVIIDIDAVCRSFTSGNAAQIEVSLGKKLTVTSSP